ncbi:hypothetical protein Tco_1090205 [Tanacetum coccineum]|uniref:Reverse transcriptase n=1 Tax=Tanacetum coccineum TaxID=301880 RepID=A0ABQ5I5Q8_9ASTR
MCMFALTMSTDELNNIKEARTDHAWIKAMQEELHQFDRLKKTVAFADEGSSNSDTDKIMARMDAMTMKMDAQYKEIQSHAKCNHCRGNHSTTDYNDDDTPMSREEEANFMQTFQHTRFYNDYSDRDSNCDNWRASERNKYNRDYDRPKTDDIYDIQKQLCDFMKSQQSTNAFVKDTCMLAIFHDRIEESVEVFMDYFSVFGNSYDNYLNNLDKMLQRCKDSNLVLNWEKCHFVVKEGIVVGHKVSVACLEVNKAKIDLISKLPPLVMSKALEAF